MTRKNDQQYGDLILTKHLIVKTEIVQIITGVKGQIQNLLKDGIIINNKV